MGRAISSLKQTYVEGFSTCKANGDEGGGGGGGSKIGSFQRTYFLNDPKSFLHLIHEVTFSNL